MPKQKMGGPLLAVGWQVLRLPYMSSGVAGMMLTSGPVSTVQTDMSTRERPGQYYSSLRVKYVHAES